MDGLGHLDGQIEILEDSAKERHGAHDVHVGVDQRGRRHVQPPEVGHEGDDRSQREPSRDRGVAAGQIDERGADAAEHEKPHQEPAARHVLLRLKIAHRGGLLVEPALLVGLRAEQAA